MSSQSDATASKPDVHILGTGGTIANITGTYESESDFTDLEGLLGRAPEKFEAVANLSYTDITHHGSGSLTTRDWYDLHAEITRLASEDPPDGFVVTHGSNTSEETAYFLNLALETDIPVAVTAAQLNVTKLGPDANRNLRDAIRVVGDPNARGRGVMLVANQEIHHARDVMKVAANRPDAWSSPNAGRIGEVPPDVELYATPDRPSTTGTPFDVAGTTVEEFPLNDVQIVYSALGSDGRLVRHAPDDVAGFVVAAFPTCSAGTPWQGPQQRDALVEVAEEGTPVVICNRGLEGFKTADEPFISGDNLRPQKARILLALGLMETEDHGELQEFFEAY